MTLQHLSVSIVNLFSVLLHRHHDWWHLVSASNLQPPPFLLLWPFETPITHQLLSLGVYCPIYPSSLPLFFHFPSRPSSTFAVRPNLQSGEKSMWRCGQRLHTNTELPPSNTLTQAAHGSFHGSLFTHFWYHHDWTRSHLVILLTEQQISCTGSDLITDSRKPTENLYFGDLYQLGSTLTWTFCFGLIVLPCLRQRGMSQLFTSNRS